MLVNNYVGVNLSSTDRKGRCRVILHLLNTKLFPGGGRNNPSSPIVVLCLENTINADAEDL